MPDTSPETPPTTQPQPESGLTVVEIMIVMAVLLIGMLAITSSSLAAHTLRRADSERLLAHHALESMIERIQAESFAALGDPDGWGVTLAAALAPGGSIGDSFVVPMLEPWDAAMPVGTIRLVTDETLTDAEVGLQIGLPRDLDNDGAIDNSDVRATARLMPVIVTVRWSGINGDRQAARGLYLMGY